MGKGEASTSNTSASQDWPGGGGGGSGAPPAAAPPGVITTDPSGNHFDPFQNPYIYKIGIYGWRKRCLYLLVIILMAMVIINFALTIWIIRVMDFSIDGMGRLRILKNGLRLEGESQFLHALYAAEVHSRTEQPLKLESSRNVTINARNKEGKITNRLYIGHNTVESLAEEFTVKNSRGEILFHADDKEVMVAAKRLRVTGSGGVRFEGSVQTPFIHAEPFQQLRLESPTRTLQVKAPEGIGVESRAGDISASCLKDLTLQSKEGTIWLDSERVELKNLKTAFPSTRGRSYPGIYQLCACENGRLFLAPPEISCQADNVVCK